MSAPLSCAVALLALLACANTEPRPLPRERDDLGLPGAEEVQAPPEPEAQAALIGPPVPDVVPKEKRRAPPRAARPAEPTPPESSADPAPPPSEGSGDALFRPDGRPTWWLDTAIWQDGRVAITAEGLGDGPRAAREAAMRAAREALARETNAPLFDERAEAFLTRKLPADAPGREKHVGYVRLSVRQPPE